MDENICRFVLKGKGADTLHVLHFVLETRHIDSTVIPSAYKLCLVVSGSADITCRGVTASVKKGDAFVLLPSVPYAISGSQAFRYMYISFIGVRANILMEKLEISCKDYIFPDMDSLSIFWSEGLRCAEEALDLVGESILLYTFSKIAVVRRREDPENRNPSPAKLSAVKQYIDEHIADANMSLTRVGEAFSYNPKYLSAAFRKQFKIGLREYILFIRINRACALIQQGQESVQQIAYLCGFTDPLYFSKVFKKRMGVSPREQIRLLRTKDINR